METRECLSSKGSARNKTVFCGREIEEIQIPVPYGYISGNAACPKAKSMVAVFCSLRKLRNFECKAICLHGKQVYLFPFKGVWWGPKDQRPILALHGWQDNAGTWEKLVPLLSSDISVLAIDLPGHGHSSHYPPGQIYYLFWDGVYLVRRIVKYFNWRKVTIMGHSLGGAIGFLYAGVFPDDIDKLIQIDIVNPTILESRQEAAKCSECIDKLLKYETLSEESMPCYDYEEMLSLVEDAYKGSVSRESCEILMKRGMAPSPKGNGYYFVRDVRLKVGVAGLGFVSLNLILEFAQKIKCNVLNIKAKPGMSFEKPHYYHMVLDKMRTNAHVEFYEVDGTHHLHLNNPERISDIVNKFILQPVVPNGSWSTQDDDEMYPV